MSEAILCSVKQIDFLITQKCGQKKMISLHMILDTIPRAPDCNKIWFYKWLRKPFCFWTPVQRNPVWKYWCLLIQGIQTCCYPQYFPLGLNMEGSVFRFLFFLLLKKKERKKKVYWVITLTEVNTFLKLYLQEQAQSQGTAQRPFTKWLHPWNHDPNQETKSSQHPSCFPLAPSLSPTFS